MVIPACFARHNTFVVGGDDDGDVDSGHRVIIPNVVNTAT